MMSNRFSTDAIARLCCCYFIPVFDSDSCARTDRNCATTHTVCGGAGCRPPESRVFRTACELIIKWEKAKSCQNLDAETGHGRTIMFDTMSSCQWLEFNNVPQNRNSKCRRNECSE